MQVELKIVTQHGVWLATSIEVLVCPERFVRLRNIEIELGRPLLQATRSENGRIDDWCQESKPAPVTSSRTGLLLCAVEAEKFLQRWDLGGMG